MIKIRPQHLLRRARRARLFGLGLLICLLAGQGLYLLEWVLLPPHVLEPRMEAVPAGPVLVTVWQHLWPLLVDWAALLQVLSGLPDSGALSTEGISGWVVWLPLALLLGLVSLVQVWALTADLGQMRLPEEPASLEAPAATGTPAPDALFEALDTADDQLSAMQAVLEQLRVALINASLPEPMDDSAESLERARQKCDEIRERVRGLKAQQQVVQARAMGFRA
jgi:hypothetical protein